MAKPNPTDRKYSKEHEWALDHGDGTATVGITDYAQEMLTDIVFVELPAVGKKVEQGALWPLSSPSNRSPMFMPRSAAKSSR